MKKTIQKSVYVYPLMTPNFILVGDEKQPLPIKDFTKEEIHHLCVEFEKDLQRKRVQTSHD